MLVLNQIFQYNFFSAKLIELREEDGLFDCNCEQNCLDLITTYDIQIQKSTAYLRSSGAMVSYSEYPLVRYRRKILFSIEDLFGNIT